LNDGVLPPRLRPPTGRLAYGAARTHILGMTSTFDTLEIARRLKGAGFGDAQVGGHH
jgi:hypothetical protein